MAATASSAHAAPLARLGLEEPALGRLCRYLDALAAWSPRVNLTGAGSPAERVRLLVGDVLAAASVPRPGRLIDVGSGNGSPGLVFALLRDDLLVTLLEPRLKRWAFLREAVRAARPAGPVEVLQVRHDGYRGPRGATVSLRALALPLSQLEPLLAPQGSILVLGGVPTPDPLLIATDTIGGVPGGARLFRRASECST